MAKTERKVLLFVVEGLSDKVSFEGQFVNYFSTFDVQVAVMRCDVTTVVYSSQIKSYLNNRVEEFCSIEKLKKSDIKGIIHLVDTDGAFVSEDCVKQNSTDETEYTDKEILAKNRELIIERNKKKSMVLKTLCSMRTLAGINYTVYFLSRTLEHVLHNRIDNLSDQDKTKLSEAFDDLYADDLPGFLTFIADKVFAVQGDYKQTWNFIKQETNSLKRYSNLHLLFEMK
jgi:hypothetical protein